MTRATTIVPRTMKKVITLGIPTSLDMIMRKLFGNASYGSLPASALAVMMAMACLSSSALAARADLERCSELELKVAFLFDVGTASLHLADCDQVDRILESIPKQFSLEAARDFSAEDLAGTAREVLVENLGLDSAADLPGPLSCMAGAYVDTRPGDRYDIVYTPEEGLAMYLNDELLKRCDGGDQAEKFFMIWFGEQPFHHRLRDRLLDDARQRAREG